MLRANKMKTAGIAYALQQSALIFAFSLSSCQDRVIEIGGSAARLWSVGVSRQGNHSATAWPNASTPLLSLCVALPKVVKQQRRSPPPPPSLARERRTKIPNRRLAQWAYLFFFFSTDEPNDDGTTGNDGGGCTRRGSCLFSWFQVRTSKAPFFPSRLAAAAPI
jgi:hypothetical protein